MQHFSSESYWLTWIQSPLVLMLTGLLALSITLPWGFYQLNNNGYYGIKTSIAVPEIPGQPVPEHGVNIVFFGYLTCGTVCPEQLLNLTRLHTLLAQQQIMDYPVRFLFITLAPDQDDEQELKRVMQSLGKRFSYYRPTSVLAAQQLALAYTDIAARQMVNEQLEIDHKGSLFVIGPNNTLSLIYPRTQSDPQQIKSDLIAFIEQLKNTGK